MRWTEDVSAYFFVKKLCEYDRANQFSLEACDAIIEYMDEIDPDYELDIIEMCCTWTEYNDIDDLKQNFPDVLEESEEDDDDDFLENLKDRTIVLETHPRHHFVVENY